MARWESLGIPPGGPATRRITSVAAASWGKGRIDLLALTTELGENDPTSILWHRFYDDSGTKKLGWGPWTELLSDKNAIGYWARNVCAVSWGPNRIDVAWSTSSSGFNGRHVWYEKGWHLLPPEDLDLNPSAMTSMGRGSLDIFGIGGGKAKEPKDLRHGWYDPGSGWGSRTQPKVLDDLPTAATSWGPGRLDLFAGGKDGPRHSWFVRGWSAGTGEPLHGPGYVGLAATSTRPGRIDLFNTDGQGVQWNTYDEGWQGWGQLPLLDIDPAGSQTIRSDVLAAVSWSSDRLDLFAVDAGSGELVHFYGKL